MDDQLNFEATQAAEAVGENEKLRENYMRAPKTTLPQKTAATSVGVAHKRGHSK